MTKKIRQPKPITVDFETFKIERRPVYPPFPIGVSIKKPGQKGRYYGFGHLTGNNSTWAEAKVALEEAWAWPDGVLFQNGKFDVDVGEVHFGLPRLTWDRYHDTMFLLFLDDPNQLELGLKPSATRLLNMLPEEQDVVANWLVKHQPVPGIKIGKGKQSKHPAGAYLAYAPGHLVGAYADGDTIRTEKLFNLLWPKTRDRDMLVPYDRERKLMLILLEIERQGIRVDLKRLRSDVAMYRDTMEKIDAWLLKELGAKSADDLNLDSGAQLIDALVAAGKADPAKIPLTPTGKYKSDKAALEAGCSDQVMRAVLQYRAQLKTCVGTFMEPWLEMAEASNGYIFTTWNQTKGDGGGARTGRLSSSPNFQNIPKEFEAIFQHEEADKEKAKKLPKCPFKDGLPSLPMVRSYVIPYKDGHVLIDRDYSQQEPRILAHFEGGALMEQYRANPWIDFHDNAKEQLERIYKREFSRKPVKNINLGLIYGQGVGSLAEKNKATVIETKELKDAILNMYPGLKSMYKDMKLRAKAEEPIRTWGGRECFCEPPRIIEGRVKTFDYKMVNTLIQGSAADCTKEAIIRYWEAKPAGHIFLLSVHDELMASVPVKEMVKGMEVLRQAMESVEFDVPILSEGDVSNDNWSTLKTYDKKGKIYDGKAA